MQLDCLDPTQTLILTVNNRLARHLRERYDTLLQARFSSWQTLPATPLSEWLIRCFLTHNPVGLSLLNPSQEQYLWQTAAEEALSDASDSAAIREFAVLAQQVFHLIIYWEIPDHELKNFNNQHEVNSLINCIKKFKAILKQNHWITEHELPIYLLSLSATLAPPTLYLLGFDQLPPVLSKFFSKLTKTRVIMDGKESTELRQNHIGRISLDNTEQELLTMARFAKTHLQKNPAATIGCVVPELPTLRHQVYRTFLSVFIEEKWFNVSSGVALSQYPMIQTTLTLLRWCQQPLPIEALAPLLQSPYLYPDEAEKNQGAKFDALLRRKNCRDVYLQDLPETRFRLLHQYYETVRRAQKIPSEWIEIFLHMLSLVRWPAQQQQNSEEFQLFERFKKTCGVFKALDMVAQKLSFAQALSQFSLLLQNTLFQPKHNACAIQIMGTLEASGLTFDALWVMGMDNRHWPAPAKPHPLLPFALQKQYDLPHATATRELDFAQKVITRLAQAAPTVIFSTPEKENDRVLSPSTLITFFPEITREEIPLTPLARPSEVMLESIEDNHAGSVALNTLTGGSDIIQLQSLCPFRAFATIRLKAKNLWMPTLGIPNTIKGSLLHLAMDFLWEKLQDATTLQNTPADALDEYMDDAINKAFTAHSDIFMPAFFLNAEKRRLKQRIHHWLMFEKIRPPFRVIA